MSLLLENQEPKTLELMRVAIEQIQDWLVITDMEGNILYINNQVEKISGYDRSEVIGKNPSIWKSGESSAKIYTKLWETILHDRPYYGVIANRGKDGKIFYLANTISPVKDEYGEIRYFVSTAKDITQNYELKKQLHDVIHYDTLTGLCNKKYFIEKAEKLLGKAKNSAMLVMNIEKISVINNTYGFEYGDQVIKKIGQRIQDTVDKTYLMGRIEEHTFGVLIPDFKSFSAVITLIKVIESSLKKPFEIEGSQLQELYIEVSTGVGVYPSDASAGAELLIRAQTALSKVQSINTSYSYAFYTPQMDEGVEQELLLETEIHKAYENDEFIPYFQPFINIKDGRICGLEALMRRKDSKGEITFPGKFIEKLEQMGLIEKVELRFIRKVCCEISHWIDSGLKVVPVAINLSPLQFRNKNLAREIMAIIDEVGIPKNLITIEITESLLMEDMLMTKEILQQLKDEGFLISLDDFGTGYSSLGYLKEFKADQLKIDMVFIREILKSKGDQAIVKAIIAIARALEMQTVAEGIEQREQLELLAQLGCDLGQGYYWDAALPAQKIARKYLRA